jgi:hypothetical protein
MIPRDEILKANPIDAFMAAQGLELIGCGQEKKCRCPFHDDGSPSFRVNLEKQVWYCDPCGFGGTVIDFVVRQRKVSVKDAMLQLAKDSGLVDSDFATRKQKVATYEYKDQYGRPVMRVDRVEVGTKKEFFPHQIDASGKRINSIQGVQRSLYRIERWSGKPEVALVEGEKCVHALESIGIDATSCAGGANGWLDAYAAYLDGKHVDVWPDGDEPGEKWLAQVLKSLSGKVASLRILRTPEIYGDVADLIDAQGIDLGEMSIRKIMKEGMKITRGVFSPLLSSAEVYAMYVQRMKDSDSVGVDLGKWIPLLGNCTRKLLPGDLAVILSDTGVGKTTMLANVAYSQRPMPTILFELELSAEAMAERFVSRDIQIMGAQVEREVKSGIVHQTDGWDHVFICPESRLTIEDMEQIIMQSELKMQAKPGLILVDYIGLMNGPESKRYERMSNIAEGLKVMARKTNTVILIASQVGRDKERTEISLHDAKDSGSIENSAQLVIGAWRESTTSITLRILKQTKRCCDGADIRCDFDGNRQTIRQSLNQSSSIDEEI